MSRMLVYTTTLKKSFEIIKQNANCQQMTKISRRIPMTIETFRLVQIFFFLISEQINRFSFKPIRHLEFIPEVVNAGRDQFLHVGIYDVTQTSIYNLHKYIYNIFHLSI